MTATTYARDITTDDEAQTIDRHAGELEAAAETIQAWLNSLDSLESALRLLTESEPDLLSAVDRCGAIEGPITVPWLRLRRLREQVERRAEAHREAASDYWDHENAKEATR